MKKIAEIFINIPIKSIAKPYSYLIPEQFDIVKIGCRVLVPFGNRIMEGFIIDIHTDENNGINKEKLKEIIDIIDTEPWFTSGMLKTAKWMANFYLCSLGETMRLFIPGKNSVKIRPVFNVNEKIIHLEKYSDKLSLLEKNLYEFLSIYKDSDLLSLRRSFGPKEYFISALEKLLAKNLIVRSYLYKSRTSKIYATYVKLNTTVNDELLVTLSRKPAQKKALLYLKTQEQVNIKTLIEQKISLSTIKILAKLNYVLLEKKQILRDSYKNIPISTVSKKTLTAEQQKVLSDIKQGIYNQQYKFLLFGITGSGKTQVYIEMALKFRAENKQVLVLVPEIVLTGQIVKSFKEYFAEDVAVIHSRLSINERNDTFWKIRTKQVDIIIGARSALFAPFEDLGLIIMDEEHDFSYKQDEAPRYHTRDIVEKMSHIYQAVLIMGSATPSLESFYKAQKNEYKLLTMKKRIDNIPLPYIEGVDMREELKKGNRKILSHKLKELISNILTKKRQLIIMLNRRGFSTFIMCRSCGYVIKCKQCGLPLVYHKNGKLQCHHCDIIENVPDICPVCNSRYIKFFGSGTEKLEEELSQNFPNARIIRLDRDTTSKKFAHQNILKQFKDGFYDILLGTQMVAKGHDIPNVTGVGIISADSSLNLPDFRASERCFSLITQTAGRAGRGQETGQVIVQTYNLEHYAIQNGIKQDYLKFYTEELAFRKLSYYPPFCELIKLVIQNVIEEKSLQKATDIKDALIKHFAPNDNIVILGPAPAVIANFKGIYRFNLLIKTNDLEIVKSFLRDLKIDTDTNIIIDVNPINSL